MSELIPNVKWTDFAKIVKDGKIENLKSCEVTFNGSHIFTAIIPHGDMFTKEYARTQVDYLALRSNIVGGKDIQELKEDADIRIGVS